MEWIAVVAVAGLGLIFGSFANVVIWRLPRGESLSYPGSHCPVCGVPIRWYDNVPVLGWLRLGGRCRACGTPIAARYPLVELGTALLWLAAYSTWGLSFRTVFGAALFYLLLVLALIDLDTMRLPNTLVALTGAIGVAGVALTALGGTAVVPLVDPAASSVSSLVLFAVLGVGLGGGVPLAIAWAYRALRGRQGLGMGDVKLLAVLGVFLGPYVLLSLFLGSVFGSAITLVAGRAGGLDRPFPFGPFLAAGGVAAALMGEALVTAYVQLL